MFLGQKDFQQQFLIKEYVKNKFKIKIKSCQTVRDNNKIALSSRNKLLNEKELKIVSKITNKLILLRKNIKKNINLFKKIKNIKKELINSFNIKLEYLEILNKKNLSKNIRKNNFKIFIAYYIGKVRLIDNF
jgi:pantoate--beta-alanine ligase